MPGTAIVVINENEWSVEVATTTIELATGLAGRASLAAGTGMLFILPVRQVVTVDTTQMLFPIDIIFIKDSAVLSIANNISPGYLVEEATPCDMFLEVNADEADLVEVGDIITITTIQEPGIDWSLITSVGIPLVILGFAVALLGGAFKRPLKSGSSSSNPKQLGSGNPAEAHPVHCVTCGWTGYRTYGPLKPCPKCGGVVVWTFTGKTKPTFEYYWEIIDIDSGEIIQKSKPYTTIPKVYAAARSYQRGRPGKDKENLVVIRIYDNPNMEEWGKTIKYVMESGMHHGIPILIGKTPLQEAALERLWPYGIKEIHSDGDLIVISSGKKWVVTTEGGVFGEEDVLHLGGAMVEIPIKPFEERHSIHGEPRRRLVEKHGSWAVGRAEAICPENDVACVEREAKRLIETLRSRYGGEAMTYLRITNPGKSVFHIGDTISLVAFEKENKRLRSINEKEAIGEVVVK